MLGCDAQGVKLVAPDGGATTADTLPANTPDNAGETLSACSIVPIASITGCTNVRIPVPSPGITPDMVVYVDGARLGPMAWVRGTEIWGNEWYSPDGHALVVTQCDDLKASRVIGVTWGCK